MFYFVLDFVCLLVFVSHFEVFVAVAIAVVIVAIVIRFSFLIMTATSP